ncbi:unnamed protein product [Ectocarpus sp. CCAP 1310/34]|nr:unnamed protein product [Ectocarpus sp. CCAP 1310/34]
MVDKKAVSIMVPSKDPKKKDGDDKDGGDKKKEGGVTTTLDGVSGDGGKKTKKTAKGGSKGVLEPEELSEEDKALKDGLELAVMRVGDKEPGIVRNALRHLSSEIRSATTSMTSVPKPLKFLRPHYAQLKKSYESWPAATGPQPVATPLVKQPATAAAGAEEKMVEVEQDEGEATPEGNKRALADILSVLAMTMADPGSRVSLKYKLEGTKGDLGRWGHEFLRSLAGEIGQEYSARRIGAVTEGADGEGDEEMADAAGAEADVSDLIALVDDIVPFHLQHNAEAEAVDLLVEVQRLKKLLDLPYVDDKNYERVCLYLLRMADYMSDPDDLMEMMTTAFELYRMRGKYCDAVRVALRMDDSDLLAQLLAECEDKGMTQQMSFIMARHRASYEHPDDDEVNEIIGNGSLSEHYLALARDLDVMEAKTPEDIYKSHLAESGGVSRRRDGGAQQVDSARANLASTFVNAFVNAGYGQDQLMTTEGNAWLYKNKDHGMMSAAASLGTILLWNVEEGLMQAHRQVLPLKRGLHQGRSCACRRYRQQISGVRNESDPALALLADHVESPSHAMRCGACVGLGVAYAGARREDVVELLTPLVANTENANMVEVGLAALSLGMIFVGTCNEEVGSVLVQRLMESSDTELEQPMARLVSLGLGLLFIGKNEQADAMMEIVKTIEHRMGRYTQVVLDTCAYAGTGNVLKVQEMLHLCAEHLDEKAEHQAAAVLGISLVTLGDDIGSEMALRTFDHLLHYGELPIRRVVPLALALLNISHPDMPVIDQLSRLTHDADTDVAQSAIMALGLVSAGTNNSRVAQLLRQLSEFYAREASHLFVTRIAQGLNHMGKGLMSLHPFHSDRGILNPAGLAGVLTVLHLCMDLKNTLLGKCHYMLFYITAAMNPRMLMTVDSDLKPLPVNVRVGQAVETVGQAGKPKTITGFQTHTTPVLLGVRDRAELATNEWIPSSNVLEGVVILTRNPELDDPPAAAAPAAEGGVGKEESKGATD